MKDARERLGPDVGVQGNLESAVLLGTGIRVRIRVRGRVRVAGYGLRVTGYG